MAFLGVGPSYEWNIVCEVCGIAYKASTMRKRWDGYIVCPADYETRHPADFYRPRNDVHVLPYTNNDDAEIDVSPAFRPGTLTPLPCGGSGQFGYVGVGRVGCMIVGRTEFS